MSYDSTRKPEATGGQEKKGGYDPSKKQTGFTGGDLHKKGATPGQKTNPTQDPKKF